MYKDELQAAIAAELSTHSDLDYDDLLDILPKNIKPAYDGLTVKI